VKPLNNLEEVKGVNQLSAFYAIDLDWYQQSDRSFAALAESRMCASCREKLKAKLIEKPPEILATIRDCCSKAQGFITPHLSILETIFRIFLANGNQVLSLEELNQQLRQRRQTSHTPAPEVLRLLLDNDRYYGFRLISQDEEEEGQQN
jgi:hypothetical protein